LTCTEVLVRFRRPPAIYSDKPAPPNYFRFRISPDVVIAVGMRVLDDGEVMSGRPVELTVTENPGADAMDAYERLLHDAMRGDASLFAREDSVEEAWRIVDPMLAPTTPPTEYAPSTWGPPEAAGIATDHGGWHDPA
jgi:glucose-6-phosphate 1-dehydrogenase